MNEKEKRQKLIEKLYLMIRDANKRKGGTKRIEIIYHIDALATFMYYTGMIKEHEYNFFMKKVINIGDELRLVYKRRNEIFEELFENNYLLLSLYEDALNSFTDLPKKTYDTIVDYDIMIKATTSFLKYSDCYSVYEECKNNDRLVRGSSLTDKETIDNIDSSYIVLGNYKKNSFEYFSSLVHAIAHAKVNKIIQKDNICYYEGELFSEIIPRLYESMFIDYLSSKNILSKDKIRNIMLNQKSLVYDNLSRAYEVASSIENMDDYRINYLRYKNLIGDMSPFVHHAVLGDLLSTRLFKSYLEDKQEFIRDLPYIIESFKDKSLEELIKEYYDVYSLEKKFIK